MNYNGFIYDAIVPIHCGSKKGTAFFIESNRLITARHVVVDALRNNIPVKIILKDKKLICSNVEIIGADNDLSDVAILIVNNYIHATIIPLLSMPTKVEKKLFVVGYPLEIGNNRDLFDFEIHNSTTVTGNEYDVVASPKELIPFSSYHGFSGSPVITDDGFVVGVITAQISRVIGYSSVMQWHKELTCKGLNIIKNWEDYDDSAYGYGRSVKLVKAAAENAGDRYSPKIHIENKDLETDLNFFCNKTEQKRIKSIYPSIEDWYINLKSKYSFIQDKYEIGVYEELAPSLRKFRNNYNDRERDPKLIEYQKVKKEDIDELKKQFEKLNEIYNISRDLLKFQCAFIHGIAGSGKTHSLCMFAEHHKVDCQPYLLYGGQYVANESFVLQTETILGFPNGLEGLDIYMNDKNRYAVIIVDAINEGVGLNYWKDILMRLPQDVEKYKNIRFVFSARIPDNSDFNIGPHNKWVVRSIEGFYDYEEAIDKYFDKFGVDKAFKKKSFFEFYNPLFLRIFCIAYNRIPNHKRQSITKLELFLIYLQVRNEKIAEIIDEDSYLDVTSKYLINLAEISLDNSNYGEITRDEARSVSYNIYHYKSWRNSLLYACLKETLLLESYGNDRNTPCVEYEFENLGDFLRVAAFLKKEMKKDEVTKYLTNKKNQVSAYGNSRIRFIHFVGALLSIENDNLKEFTETVFAGKEWDDELYDTLQYRGPLRLRILTKFINEGNDKLLPSLIRDSDAYSYAEMKSLHNVLMQMSLTERDLKWSIQVNHLYDWNGKQLFVDMKIAKQTEDQTDDDLKKVLLLMVWLLSSSYPTLRAIIIRHISHILTDNPLLANAIIELFRNCNDPYVINGLYCAIYGVTLNIRDTEAVDSIAKIIYKFNYADESVIPNDWMVRYWTMKILERANFLNHDINYWDKVHPPFHLNNNPYNLLNNVISIDSDYFGNSKGSEHLYFSLFNNNSDFNRYIIGTNFSSTDGILINKDTNKSVQKKDIVDMIGVRVKELGWNDDLGRYDDDKYSVTSYVNETERMGKKYQWIAYYDIMGRLTDCCFMRKEKYGEGKNEMQNINYPWYADIRNYFDPSLDVNAYRETIVNLSVIGDMNVVGENEENWIDNNDLLPAFRFKAKDDNGNVYIMLYGFEMVKKEGKEFAVISNSAFVRNGNVTKFKKWCETQNFYGRWMPERTGSIDFLWNEYPWADSYKSSIEEHEWERPSNDCPCDIMLSYTAQLQEYWEGIAYEDEYLPTVYMPCRKIMEEMRLYCSKVRGIIKSEKDDSIVAVNLSAEVGMSGLFIRKDVLDKFLTKNRYTMFYYVLGEKVLRNEKMVPIMKDISAAFQYDIKKNIKIVQPIRII